MQDSEVPWHREVVAVHRGELLELLAATRSAARRWSERTG